MGFQDTFGFVGGIIHGSKMCVFLSSLNKDFDEE